MATFVLVHGAWQGAGTWRPTVERLEKQHRVFTPTLTGLGTSAHLLDERVNLTTHVNDLIRFFDAEALSDVILVAHSYAGMVVTEALETLAPSVRQVVYVDAFVPTHGQSAMALFPEKFRTIFKDQAAAAGGWRLPGFEKRMDLWGLKPGPEREFVKSQLCDFSIRCFDSPLNAPTGRAANLPRGYVACVAPGYPARPIFEPFSSAVKDAKGWRYWELSTGHDCHVEEPDAFADILKSLV